MMYEASKLNIANYDVHLVGSTKDLRLLFDAVCTALSESEGHSQVQMFTSDGEKLTLHIVRSKDTSFK